MRYFVSRLSEEYPELIKAVALAGTIEESRVGVTREVIALELEIEEPEHCVVGRHGLNRDFMDLEIAMILSGTFDEDLMRATLPRAADLISQATAYGPRTANQLLRVEDELRRDRSSRRAVVYVGRADDLQAVNHPTSSVRDFKGEMPCTMAWQFLVRRDRLHMLVTMRSWDLVWGLSYDVPCFVAVQMALSAALGVGIGRYHHTAGSAHIYDRHWGLIMYPNFDGRVDVPWIGQTIQDTQDHAKNYLTALREQTT